MEKSDNKLRELYTKSLERVHEVYNIFVDYFGENKVDLQKCPTFENFIYKINTLPVYDFLICPNINSSEYIIYNECKCKKIQELEEREFDYFMDNVKIPFIYSYITDIPEILVYYPSVTVTNEFGKSIIIKELYIKIKLTLEGQLKTNFLLNRAEYSSIQFKNDYLHSHVCSIPNHDFTNFQSCCLGNGPIKGTIDNLHYNRYDENIWRLFCVELDKYVHTESLEGGPYHRLENVGKGISGGYKLNIVNKLSNTVSYKKIIKEFLIDYINEGLLKFNYKNNSFSLGMSKIDFIVSISNSFIQWFNKSRYSRTYTLDNLINGMVIKKCIIENNDIYILQNTTNDYSQYIGKRVCKFKGKDITLNITNNFSIDNYCYLLYENIISFILLRILKVLNFKYGRKEYEKTESDSTEKFQYF
jgi:hypothetical protein